MALQISFDSGKDHVGRRFNVSTGHNIYPAQTFTPNSSFDITSISLLIGRRGTAGTCSISFYTTDGNGHPDTFLASVGFSAAQITPGSASMSSYESATTTSVTSNTLHEVYPDDDTFNGCTLLVADTTYHYGMVLVTDYIGATGTVHFTDGLDTGNPPDSNPNYLFISSGGPLATDWKNVPITGLTFEAGIKYAIRFSTSVLGSVQFPYWALNTSGGYSGGNALRSINSAATWIDLTGDFLFKIYGDDVEPPPEKPTTPTPANEATEVDFSGFTLSWVNGGGATSYDVYIGPSGSLVKVSSSQAGTSYVTNIDEVPYNQVIYWRIDAINNNGTTTGDNWNFDARPGAAITPYPGNATSGITLDDTTATWESGSDNTINYDIYFRPFGEFYELVDSDITDLSCILYETNYHYGWLYFWSVVAKNKFGTYPESAPDGFLSDYEWYFNAMVFSPVLPTGVTMVDGKPASGTTGTPTGENNMMTTKRLVAAAQNKIWYEAI